MQNHMLQTIQQIVNFGGGSYDKKIFYAHNPFQFIFNDSPTAPFLIAALEGMSLGFVSDVIGNFRCGFQKQLEKIEGEQNITKSNAT